MEERKEEERGNGGTVRGKWGRANPAFHTQLHLEAGTLRLLLGDGVKSQGEHAFGSQMHCNSHRSREEHGMSPHPTPGNI
jgi:hypothetical protein